MKHQDKINQGQRVDDVLTQIKQAFSHAFTKGNSKADCHVSVVLVINSGEITQNARQQLWDDLKRERYGDNVVFLDGHQLRSLSSYATADTQRHDRHLLLSIRATLYYNKDVIEGYRKRIGSTEGDFRSLLLSGIEDVIRTPHLLIRMEEMRVVNLLSTLHRINNAMHLIRDEKTFSEVALKSVIELMADGLEKIDEANTRINRLLAELSNDGVNLGVGYFSVAD